MTTQQVNMTMKPLKHSAVAPYDSDDGAEDAISYKDNTGNDFNGGSGTFYMQKPGQGNYIVQAKMQSADYDWRYDYIGQSLLNFYWDSGALMYDEIGAWRVNGLYGELVWSGDQPAWGIGTSMAEPTDINVLIGYSTEADPNTIVTWPWPEGIPAPVTKIYDTDENEIWDGSSGSHTINWVGDCRMVGKITLTASGGFGIARIYASRIGVMRDTT